MASPTNVRHELANALIEHDGTADESVQVLLEHLTAAEANWLSDPVHWPRTQSFLNWLAS